MEGYTKVFASMLDSTVWGSSKEARLLWITLLLKRNRDQIVEASIPGLANAARLTIEETEKALEELMRPDPYSRTPEHDGRRIEKVDGGWWIVNGQKYRDMLNADARREYQRIKQAEYRARKREKEKKGWPTPGVPLPGERAYEQQLKEGVGDGILKTFKKVAYYPDNPQIQLASEAPGKEGVEG